MQQDTVSYRSTTKTLLRGAERKRSHLLMEKELIARKKVAWISVIVFYVLACAISWPFFWWRDMQPEAWRSWNVPPFIKTWSYMWGPGLSALACFLIFRRTHVRTVTFFGTSLLQSLLFYVVPILGLAIAGIDDPSMNRHVAPLVFGVIGFISILGEELGWRGFLQDALRPLKPVYRYVIIAILWELWHFTNRMSQGELLQIVIRVSIFIIALVIISAIIGEATDRSRSLVIAVTLHAWIDILAEYNHFYTFIVFGLSLPFWAYLLWRWNKKGAVEKSGWVSNA
jgi:membrane protease YdiL (CAAX protease family)